jgi:hypothetical protein
LSYSTFVRTFIEGYSFVAGVVFFHELAFHYFFRSAGPFDDGMMDIMKVHGISERTEQLKIHYLKMVR